VPVTVNAAASKQEIDEHRIWLSICTDKLDACDRQLDATEIVLTEELKWQAAPKLFDANPAVRAQGRQLLNLCPKPDKEVFIGIANSYEYSRTPEDLTLAALYNKKAADVGDIYAGAKYAFLLSDIRGGMQVAPALAMQILNYVRPYAHKAIDGEIEKEPAPLALYAAYAMTMRVGKDEYERYGFPSMIYAADAGNQSAAFMLACMYKYGCFTQKSEEKARVYLQRLLHAEDTDPILLGIKAHMYASGQFITQNIDASRAYCALLREKGESPEVILNNLVLAECMIIDCATSIR
jgi:hypothetical protein